VGNLGRGVHSEWASPELVNCTIVGNTATEGGGVAWEGDYVPVLRNCVVWGNAGGPLVPLEDTQSQIQVSYSIVEGDPLWPDEGNRNDDPLFVGGGDYHLQAGSPAIDQGAETDTPVLDLEGYARPCGEGVDMGAYERGSCLPIALNVLGEEPDSIVQDGRAVAYIGTVTFPPGSASVLESLRFRDVGRGNAATLVKSAQLYVDDGDGVFTEADEPLGAASDFDPATQEILFDSLAHTGDPESTVTYILVCDLVMQETSSAALPVALATALLLSLLGMRRRRAGWLLPTVFLLGMLSWFAPVGCGGDGGDDVVVLPSRDLQLELVELEIVGPTGLAADVGDLPSTAWSFEG
jgi:hypothetical protein